MSNRATALRDSLMIALLGLCALQSAFGQAPETPPKLTLSTGVVEGHVFAAETNLPLRFAEIRLVPKPSEADLQPEQPLFTTPETAPHKPAAHTQFITGTSGFDGSFHLEQVPAGDYLVGALKNGYVTPAPDLEFNTNITPDQLKTLGGSLPEVHVAVGQIATVDLNAHRGAIVAGRAIFADGSPAIGMLVSLANSAYADMDSKLRSWTPSPYQRALSQFDAFDHRTRNNAVTDDDGRYRFAGVSPGRYIVSGTLSIDHNPALIAMNDGSTPNEAARSAYPESIAVYSPGVFRASEASVTEIHGSEKVLDANIKIDPTGLFSIRGTFRAATDGHTPNGAFVFLTSKENRDIHRIVQALGGTFQINYVPSGSYTLMVIANDLSDNPSAQAPLSYKNLTITVAITNGDVDLKDLLLAPLKPGEQNTFPEF